MKIILSVSSVCILFFVSFTVFWLSARIQAIGVMHASCASAGYVSHPWFHRARSFECPSADSHKQVRAHFFKPRIYEKQAYGINAPCCVGLTNDASFDGTNVHILV